MAKCFEVTVTVQHEVDGGKGGTKIKKVRESYLVDAMTCLLYTSPSPRDRQKSRMPSSA